MISDTERQEKTETTLPVALVLLSLGKPLVEKGGFNPAAVEEQQHRGQDNQEGEQQRPHQTSLTCGHTRKKLPLLLSIIN